MRGCCWSNARGRLRNYSRWRTWVCLIDNKTQCKIVPVHLIHAWLDER